MANAKGVARGIEDRSEVLKMGKARVESYFISSIFSMSQVTYHLGRGLAGVGWMPVIYR
jgi:hypothetical protein